jgi:hypothetical protein
VLERLVVQERAGFLELREDRFLRLAHAHAREEGHGCLVAARVVHGLVQGKPALHADLEILDAMRGRRVHQARAGFRRHVLREHDRHDAIDEGVAKRQPFERHAGRAPEDRFRREAIALQRRLAQRLGHDQRAAIGIDQLVADVGVRRDRLVAGQRPGRRGPDDRIRACELVLRVECLRHRRGIDRFECDVHGGRGAVLVLDFRFGERAAAIDAPVHGLQAAVEKAVLPDLPMARISPPRWRSPSSCTDGPSRPARPGAGSPPSALDLLGRVRAAERALLVGLEVAAVLLLDLVLDGKPVAIPSGRIGRVVAGERLRLHHHVLQDLVHRVAHVDVAVRVRRAIVQDVLVAPAAMLADALVEAVVEPRLQPHRLPLRQIAAHGKRRFRKVQRALVVDLLVVGHPSVLRALAGVRCS